MLFEPLIFSNRNEAEKLFTLYLITLTTTNNTKREPQTIQNFVFFIPIQDIKGI